MIGVALLAHGAGSCPETVRRLLGPCVPPGARVAAPHLRAGPVRAADALDAARGADRVALAAGVSLGAHAVALWAARAAAEVPLALVMPAWTDVPGPVAALTGEAADVVEREGIMAALGALRADPALHGDWVLDELERGWTTYDDADLVAALRVAASSQGPGLEVLGALRGPVAVVALADDPLHPVEVARAWAEEIPRSALRVVGRQVPREDPGALGRAAREALAELT
jgi:pimeloyl-ACP methyl ester carboxylesterase